MNELVKSIIFAVLGAVVVATGVIINAGVEVIALGAVITAFAAGLIIAEIVKKNKK